MPHQIDSKIRAFCNQEIKCTEVREENRRRTAVFIPKSSREIKEQKIVSETQEKKKKQSKFLELGRLHEIDHFQREMNRFMPNF